MVCLTVILLCYGITCLWFCNKRSGVNYQLIKKGVICAGSCISTLTAELHTHKVLLVTRTIFILWFFQTKFWRLSIDLLGNWLLNAWEPTHRFEVLEWKLSTSHFQQQEGRKSQEKGTTALQLPTQHLFTLASWLHPLKCARQRE